MLIVRPIEGVKTLLDWYKIKDRIDFAPTYQRKGEIWKLRNKQLFINTILNSYDFPKIYLADFSVGSTTLNENRKQFAVIDGKQRLSAIFSFIENLYLLDNTQVYFEGEKISLGGYNFDTLQNEYPLIAKRLEDYIPTVMGVESDRIEDIYEMFIRLNINVTISGPERRNALPGPVPGLIRRIALHKFFSEKTKFTVERGQDLNAAAKILSIELNNGHPVSTKKQDLDNVVTKGERMLESQLLPFVERAEQELFNLCKVFEKKDELLASQTLLSVYYIFIRNNYSDDKSKKIRGFLNQFELERKNAKKILKDRALGQIPIINEKIDEDYIAFNSLVRSPDDKVSNEEMLKILSKRFQEQE